MTTTAKKFGIYHSERGWFILADKPASDAEAWTRDATKATHIPKPEHAIRVLTASYADLKGKIEARELPAS